MPGDLVVLSRKRPFLRNGPDDQVAKRLCFSARDVTMLQAGGVTAGTGNIGAVYLTGAVVYQSIARRAWRARWGEILAAGGGSLSRDAQSSAVMPPDAAVTAASTAFPGEGMSQLVQQRAPHQFRVACQIVCQKMAGESDTLFSGAAAAQAAGGAVSSESPPLQPQGSKTPRRPLSRKIRAARGRAGW